MSEDGLETDEPVTAESVLDEVHSVMSKHHITKWAGKTVSRKYAFELPDIPAQAHYLKVVYSFQCKSISVQ